MQGKGVDYGDPNGLYTQPRGRIGRRVDDAVAMLTGQPLTSGSTTVTLPAPTDQSPDLFVCFAECVQHLGALGPYA